MFFINFPTKIYIGVGASKKVGETLAQHGVEKALVIFDQGIRKAGIADLILENIQKEGITVFEYDKVTPDPIDTLVNEAAAIGRKEQVDAVVGLGGGSPMDTAKATNVLLGNDGEVADYFGLGIEQKPGKLLFTIPTTAGTGAEVSDMAVISDSKTGQKNVVAGPYCAANYAFVDPQLTVSVPPHITASTGMDTLAHNVEAYTSLHRNPMSDILAKEGIRLVAQNLLKAVNDGQDIEARTAMSIACTYGSLAFAEARLHIGHALGTPFGVRFNLPHGTACGIWLSVAVEFLAKVLPDRVRCIGEAFGLNFLDDIPIDVLGDEVGNAIRKLARAIKFPTLKELGVTEEHLPIIVDDALGDLPMQWAPQKPTREELLKLVEKEYALS